MSLDKRKSATTKWQIEDQNQPRYFNSQPPSYDTANAAVLKLRHHQAISAEIARAAVLKLQQLQATSAAPQRWPMQQSLRPTTPLPHPPTYLRDVDEFDPFQSEGDTPTGAAYHMPTHAAYPPRAAVRYCS